MTLTKIAVVTVFLLVAWSALSRQDPDPRYLSGSQLLAYCESDTVTTTGTWCLGYVLGVWRATAPQHQACPPEDVTAGQLRHVVLRYLEARRTLAAQPVELVRQAMKIGFPCD
jgi:hypothetical protein